MQKASEGKSTAELMRDLDNHLTYGGARRISEYEAELLDQIDESCDQQIGMKRELDATKRNLEITQERQRRTDKAIEDNCSETTRLKIRIERGDQLGMAEKIDEQTVLSSPSDKQLVAELEKSKRKITMQTLVTNALESQANRSGEVDKADSVELPENLKEGVSLDD